MENCKILPSSVEIKYNCVNIDGFFISTIAVLKFELNVEIIRTMNILMKNYDVSISMHFERKNSVDFLKKLTGVISKSSSEIKTISKNQIDINILDDVKQNAIDLRKKIQVDNEQVYMLGIYITVKGIDYNEVTNKTRNIINVLFSNKIIAKPCNFMQKEGYIASLPLMNNEKQLSKYTNFIFTQNGVAKLFPFYTKNILDENGIIVGFANNNICALDIFSERNNNYNTCIFGSSGTGKSYFVKLMIIRNRYKNIKQIIIDPEGEYVDIVKSLGGKVITLENFNPFYISQDFVKNNENFFEEKICNVSQTMCEMFEFKNISQIKEAVIKMYKKYNINQNKKSLYKTEDETNFYLNPKYISRFPNINDFLKELKMISDIKDKAVKKINRDFKNNEKILWNEGLYCFNLKNKTIKEIEHEMKIFLPFICEILQEKALIYFDELWKLICSSNDDFLIKNIYNMFKTLRKKQAGITIISQDITDLFNVDNGNFGKSILNNSNMKVLFKMEWTDIEIFEKLRMSGLDVIKGLERGICYVELGSSAFNLEVKATNYEHKLIEGE